MRPNSLYIYTDGSCYRHDPNRMGGYGVLYVFTDEFGDEKDIDEYDSNSHRGTTNNKMELEGAIFALKKIFKSIGSKRFEKIVIRSDSDYVVNGTRDALFWYKNKWRTNKGNPVKYPDLWKEFLNLKKKINDKYYKWVEFEWVPGKKGKYAKKVDKLAKKSAKKTSLDKSNSLRVRKKWTDKETERGSVSMFGQDIKIRIISSSSDFKNVHQYRYEVISKDSEYFGYADFIFSNKILGEGHCYHVTLNDKQDHPQITNIIEEIDKTKSLYYSG